MAHWRKHEAQHDVYHTTITLADIAGVGSWVDEKQLSLLELK